MLNFGPIQFLVTEIMLPFLNFSYHHIIPNYGVAIILLTLIIKVLFYPLMAKQYASMQAMKIIQPKVKKLREQHAKNPQKMQQEMMKLYKEHNVNPLKGCLPMIIQIPFFLGIYATIMSDAFKTVIYEPGINKGFLTFWLSDLALPDKTMILPIVLAIFTYWSQKMMMADPQQQKFLFFSPILIVGFGFNLPAGVLLYWAVSTIGSTAQQYFALKKEAPTPPSSTQEGIVIPVKHSKKK